ncbi:MAG: TrmH family RNA methyltransferase [Candidatus Cloacimonadales bacterium]
MKFSQAKFQSLPAARQINKYLDFISLIEQNWAEADERRKLIAEFQKCLSYSEDVFFQNIKLADSSLREFIGSSIEIQKKYGRAQRDHELLIKQADGEREVQKKPIYLVLSDLRSAFNIGSIFRSAECFGVSEILLVGYTAGAENQKVIKTSMNCTKRVASKHFSSLQLAVEYLKRQNVTIYGLETVQGASAISDEKMRFPAAFVLGNEALGLPAESLQLTDKILQISLSGWKNSLNVGVTAAICCYEASRQLNL